MNFVDVVANIIIAVPIIIALIALYGLVRLLRESARNEVMREAEKYRHEAQASMDKARAIYTLPPNSPSVYIQSTENHVPEDDLDFDYHSSVYVPKKSAPEKRKPETVVPKWCAYCGRGERTKNIAGHSVCDRCGAPWSS